MKKLLAAFSAVAALGLTAAQAAESLTVVATPVPHAEILTVSSRCWPRKAWT